MGTLYQTTGWVNRGFTGRYRALSDILCVVEGKVPVLTWTENTDGWHADGLRIELAAPFRWLVLDDDSRTTAVSLEEAPLAVTRTLTEAKREAELVADARRRADLRKKHMVILGLVFAVGVLLLGESPVQNIAVAIAVATLATRSLGVVAGTILARSNAATHEVFYQ